MKASLLFTRMAALHLLAGVACAQGPVLTTPGTASWASEATATGTRTVFTLTGNTVLTWEQLNLANGSEMVFDFTGGNTVVNFLEGTGTHLIDGSITSNGIVAFFSPRASLEVNGSIIAKGVTLATLNADASAFAEGNYEMSGLAGFKSLRINGHVEATDGDVVLGGETIRIGDGAKIKASQDALIAAGRNVSVSATGDRRLQENSGVGFVLHMGETGASRIEVAAGREINNQGTFNAGQGRIFLAVGSDGLITNESSGILVADEGSSDVLVSEEMFEGEYDSDGSVLDQDEGDTVPAVNESTLTIPSLSRPDGTKVNVSIPEASNTGAGAPDTSQVIGNETGGGVSSQGPISNNAPNGPLLITTQGGAAPAGREPTMPITSFKRPVGTKLGTTSPQSDTAAAGEQNAAQTSTAPRTISYSVPMSASGDAQRDAAARTRVADKRVVAAGRSKAMMSRSSFFGLRGGNTLVANR